MSTCPVCLEPLDPKGRVVHRCTPRPDLPPPPRPQESGFVPPPQGSRTPVFVVLGLLGLAVVGVVFALVAGRGGDDAEAAPTTEPPTATTVAETVAETLPATTVVETVPPTVAPTAPPPPPPPAPAPTEAPTTYDLTQTGCGGMTTDGRVPIVFLDSVTARGEVTSCRFAGRWMYVILTSVTNGVQEGWVFNIDEPTEFGRPLPQLAATPSGCILEIVLDPATATILSEGLPQGPCPRA
jgi:hypothetical protein